MVPRAAPLKQYPASSGLQIAQPGWLASQFRPAQVKLFKVMHARHALRQRRKPACPEIKMGQLLQPAEIFWKTLQRIIPPLQIAKIAQRIRRKNRDSIDSEDFSAQVTLFSQLPSTTAQLYIQRKNTSYKWLF
jgi:hypothetical protein